MSTGSGAPAGPPFPTPVEFDFAAAGEALTALTYGIHTLKTRTASGFRSAARAQQGWQGAAADQFATGSLPWMASESARILDGMLRTHHQISSAIEAARTLQHQHNLANQHWAEAQHRKQKP